MARPQAADYEDRKQEIVDKAADLFATHSFLGTSINDIAAACGFSKSLLYHYFKSKEELLAAVMHSHVDVLEGLLDKAEAKGNSPHEILRHLLEMFMAEYAGAAAKQRVLLYELENLPAKERKIIVRKQRKIVDFAQTQIVALRPQLKKKPAEARAMTMLVFGMINWTSNWYDPAGPISPEKIANMAFAMIEPDS